MKLDGRLSYLAGMSRALVFVLSMFAAPAMADHVKQLEPNSPEVWRELDARARDKAVSVGYSHVAAPVHLEQHGFLGAKTTISVEGGRCYIAAYAWSFNRELQLGVGYPPDAGGRRANDQSAGDVGVAQPPARGLLFCADRSGKVRLSVDPQGQVGRQDMYEYSPVVGWRAEPAADAVKRRTAERQRTQAQARDVAQWQRETRAEQQASLDESCHACRDAYTSCQLTRKSERSPGRFERDCEGQLRRCASDVGMVRGMGARSADACGTLPR